MYAVEKRQVEVVRTLLTANATTTRVDKVIRIYGYWGHCLQ
jgi:hypothetical protein